MTTPQRWAARLRLTTAVLLVAAGGGVAQAQSGTWGGNNSGFWDSAGNWSGGVIASGTASTANFTPNISANRTVTLGVNRTINKLNFSDGGALGFVWTVAAAGGEVLTLARASDGFGGFISASVNTTTIAVVSAPVTATHGFTKNGGAALTLGGTSANAITGSTNLTAGSLNLDKSSGIAIGGTINVSDGATLNALRANQFATSANVSVGMGEFNYHSNTLNSLFLGSFTSTGNATARPGSSADLIVNTLGSSTGSTLDLSNGSVTVTAGGTLSGTLAGSGGRLNVQGGTFTLAGTGPQTNSYSGLTSVTGGTLVLDRTGGGAVGGNVSIDAMSAGVRLNQGSQISGGVGFGANGGTLFLNGQTDTIAYLRSTGTAGVVSLGSGALTIFADTSSSTFSGIITGSGTLTKLGNGFQTLGGTSASDFTGLTTIGTSTATGGILNLSKSPGANAIGGSLTINVGTVALLASEQLPDSAVVTVNTGGTLNIGSNTETFARLVVSRTTGTGISGTGTMRLTSTGSSLFTAGTGTVSANLEIVSASGGTIVYQTSPPQGAKTLTLAGSLGLGGLERTVFAASNHTLAVGGVVSNGGLLKTGDGTLRLEGSSANLYTGTTTASAGTLELGKSAGVDAVAGVSISGGTLKHLASDQIGGGRGVAISSGLWDLNGFSETVSVLNGAGGTVRLNGGTLTVDQTVDTTFSGVVEGGATSVLNKYGAGHLVLAGASSNALAGELSAYGSVQFAKTNAAEAFNGLFLEVRGGGTATWVGDDQIGNSTRLTLYAGGTANLNGRTDRVGDLAGQAGSTLNLTNGSLTVTQATDFGFSGTITGGGALTKGGPATLVLGGASPNGNTGLTTLSGGKLHLNKPAGVNALGGDATVSGGRLRLFASEQLPNTATVSLTGGAAEFSLDGDNGAAVSETIGGLQGTAGTVYMSPGSALTVNQVSAGTLTFAGNFTGGGTLTKSGAGTLTLGGTNALAATVVSQGRLVVNGSHAGTVQVNAAGTLGGTGTLTGLVTTSGTVAPGGSAGTLALNGGLTMTSGSYQWELAALTVGGPGANFDRITSTGPVTLGGTAVVDLAFIGSATNPDSGDPFWSVARQWSILDAAGGSLVGNFAGVTNAQWSSGVFSLSTPGDQVFLTFTPVPEPAPLGLLAAVFVAWAGVSRWRAVG